jgi:hypothetical protein
MNGALEKIRIPQQEAMKGNRRFYSGDPKIPQGFLYPHDGFQTISAPGDYLG